MWATIEFIVLVSIGLTVLIEILIPGLTGKPMFPSFRKKKQQAEEPVPVSHTPELDEMIVDLKNKVESEEKETVEAIETADAVITKKRAKLDKVQEIKDKTVNL